MCLLFCLRATHPLALLSCQVLDGPSDELRYDALDTICALAMALGQDFTIFVPTICKVRLHSPCPCPSPQNTKLAGVLAASLSKKLCAG